MSKLQTIWIAILALLYAMFWVWYGGNGDPLTQAEGEAMLREMEQVHGTTAEEAPEGSFFRNIQAMIPNDDGKEFYAVNLETQKKDAAGREADSAYAGIVMPLLFKRGAHPVFVSQRAGLMLGEYGNAIDRVAVVRYRSLRDLIDMVSDPGMVEGEKYKTASLLHTEVFITRPTITFLQVRLFVGLLLFFIGVLGWLLLGRISKRSNKESPDAGA